MIPAGIIATHTMIIPTPVAMTIPGRPVAKRRARSSGPSMNRLSPPSTRIRIRSMGRTLSRPARRPGRGRWDRWFGRTSNDSIREKTSTEITMIGICPMILPSELGMKKRGQKATPVVRTANTTGVVIRRVPRIDAATPRRPFSRSA